MSASVGLALVRSDLGVTVSIPSPGELAGWALDELAATSGVAGVALRSTNPGLQSQVMIGCAADTAAQVRDALLVDPVVLPDDLDLVCTVVPLAVQENVVARLSVVHTPEANLWHLQEKLDQSATVLVLASVAVGAPLVRFGVDALTGRPNREFALTHLAERLREGRTDFAVLFCDLDGFKSVNDTLGHGVGDGLLRQVADRLAGALPQGGVLARVGGDEFVAIVHAPTTIAAQRCAATLIDSLLTDFVVGPHTVSVGVSVGIAMPAPAMDADALICAADVAMYEAKKLRSCTHALYTPALHVLTEKRLTLERDLRHAISREELSIVFQPVTNLRTGALAGVETLLRWVHPTLGEVTPTTFIPLAEKSGLIDDLGRFALTNALREFVALKDRHGPSAPGYVAVNVSRYELDAPGFIPHLAATVEEFGILPSELHLELTESATILDATSARMTLLGVTDLGIGLDVDDFGSGYSSLAYLVRLRSLTSIKLDSSMIWQLAEDERAQVTVRALIGLAHHLGLQLLAEGIETTWQHDWLLANGCDLGQGFVLSRPLPPAVLSDLLTSLRGRAQFFVPQTVK